MVLYFSHICSLGFFPHPGFFLLVATMCLDKFPLPLPVSTSAKTPRGFPHTYEDRVALSHTIFWMLPIFLPYPPPPLLVLPLWKPFLFRSNVEFANPRYYLCFRTFPDLGFPFALMQVFTTFVYCGRVSVIHNRYKPPSKTFFMLPIFSAMISPIWCLRPSPYLLMQN